MLTARTATDGDEWSGRLDSNQRSSAPKADAIPGFATPRRLNSTPARALVAGFFVLRFTFCVRRSAFDVLRSAFYVRRSTLRRTPNSERRTTNDEPRTSQSPAF